MLEKFLFESPNFLHGKHDFIDIFQNLDTHL